MTNYTMNYKMNYMTNDMNYMMNYMMKAIDGQRREAQGSEGSPKWIVLLTQACPRKGPQSLSTLEGWQNLPAIWEAQKEMAVPFLRNQVWVLTVCTENVHHSFFPSPDSYGLKTAPQQRSLLQRRAKPVPLIWLSTITLSLFNSIYSTLWASGCWGFPSREPRPPDPASPSAIFFHSFTASVRFKSQEPCWMQKRGNVLGRGNSKWGRGDSGCIHF